MNDQDKLNPSIVQKNSLIESCYTMTLVEKRMLMLGMSKIDSREAIDKSKQLSFVITDEEWREYFPSNQIFRDMRVAAKRLRGRYVKFHPREGIVEEVNWFEKCRYDKNNNTVHLIFTPTISSRLTGIVGDFTKLNILSVNKLGSFYSVRLYETLMNLKYRSRYPQMKIDFNDLRIAFDCTDIYPATAEFKRRALHPAIDEINERSDLLVSYKDVKEGRSIVAFKFTVKTKPKPANKKTKSTAPKKANSDDVRGKSSEENLMDGDWA